MAQSKAPMLTNPSEPHMKPDQGPAQANKPSPPLVAKSREGGQSKKAEEPLRKQDNASHRANYDSHQRHGGRNSSDLYPKPHVKSSGGMLVEQSPIHHRTGGRGSGSQPSSSDSLQGASGRTRHRHPSRPAANNAGGGPAVPEFGSWNKNPEQAEGYTDVFNQVLSEKKTPGHNPTPTRRDIPDKQAKDNCFSRLFKCCSSDD